MKVTIVSSDKDLMQLVGNGVDMLDTMRDLRIGPSQVEEKFGVGPDKVGEVLALMGDAVDNIPGVRGVGPKTATQLIQEFGDVETLIARAARSSATSSARRSRTASTTSACRACW